MKSSFCLILDRAKTTTGIAASKKGMDDPEREKLILRIMTAMVNQEGQDHISYGKNMVPYKKDVTLDLMDEMSNLKPYVDRNKLYRGFRDSCG